MRDLVYLIYKNWLMNAGGRKWAPGARPALFTRGPINAKQGPRHIAKGGIMRQPRLFWTALLVLLLGHAAAAGATCTPDAYEDDDTPCA